MLKNKDALFQRQDSVKFQSLHSPGTAMRVPIGGCVNYMAAKKTRSCRRVQ